LYYGDAKGDYYGESSGSFMVKEFSLYEDLQEIVKLASQSMPERPDGIVCVVKFTSASRPDCRSTEAEYERLARANPATIFLRCFEEYENASLLLGQANVQTWPTYDIFYGGNRVARMEGGSYPELEELLKCYQFQNSQLDLFSEEADNKKRLAWGDGKVKDPTKTPRTTNRFIPGYDWDKDRGFFDDMGDKFQEDWDKIYGNWVPNVEDK
jgi:thiol-disulfide isomerase/thioredoxin